MILIASKNRKRTSPLIGGTLGNFSTPITAICYSDFVPRIQALLLSAILKSHMPPNLIG